MTECSICQTEIKDKINMCCGSQHSFCFKCTLKGVEVTGKLKNCPLCNGGGKYIIIDSNFNKEETDEYYSIYIFNKSINIIKKIIKDKMTNTCIISEQILQFYIANKTQLEFFHILNKDYEEDEIIKMIKWESNESVSDYEEFINGIENMISNNIHRQENVDGVRRNLVYSFGDGLSRFIGTTFRS